MPHKGPLMETGSQSSWEDEVSRGKAVALTHWRGTKADHGINMEVGYVWKVMMILAGPLINGEKDCNVQPSVHYNPSDKATLYEPLKVHVSGSQD